MTLTKIHLTGENILNGNIDSLRDPNRSPWSADFSHLDDSIMTMLKENPRHDIYLYGSVTSASIKDDPSHQVPIYTAVVIPEGRGAPTRTVAMNFNQTGEEFIRSFEEIGYDWMLHDDPSYGGRVHYLVCTADQSKMEFTFIDPDGNEVNKVWKRLEDVPFLDHLDKLLDVHFEGRYTHDDNEKEKTLKKEGRASHFQTPLSKYHEHEFASLYTMTPKYLCTNGRGKLKVFTLDITFIDHQGSVAYENWDCEDCTLSEFLDELVEYYFENANDEDKAKAREYLQQIADASIKEARATKQSNIDKFFAHLSWGKENLSELKLYKILPVNFPARITDAMMFPDRHYHLFSKQIPGALVKSFSDHSFTMGGELVEFVPIEALRNAWSGFGDIESSPTAMWFFSSVLVDFFCVTRAPPNLFGNDKTSQDLLNHIISTFGLDRVLQYMKQPLVQLMTAKAKEHFLGAICQCVYETVADAGRVPISGEEFLVDFISWSVPISTQKHDEPNFIRLNPSNTSMLLEVSGAPDGPFTPTSIAELKTFISEIGLKNLLLLLLSRNPGSNEPIPPGARGDQQDDDERFDCFKQALRIAPDKMLSPSGKRRVEIAFPSHEIGIRDVRALLQNKVKTLALKEIKSNIHAHAMTSDDVMIGVFFDKERKHCVLIDGSDKNDGTISDPLPGFEKRQLRSKRTLTKLGISEFIQVFVLKRNEMSNKNRKRAEKRLGLPFFENSNL